MFVVGLIGFIGNEVVVVFCICVGCEINLVVLIVDGYYVCIDGFISLVVVLGVMGVWFGFLLVDLIIGFLIIVIIFGIVW